ncbi:MAG: tetratricopeptide repeat protein [Gemmatimonadetes bacterium]|nr:tetratricopeptide repeat protein [Gemmatimonadota bacterium]NIS00616.1 tetratricopeptide repeat protein [Gemmatimonadota bacterium]NIY43072.1 tetratricopeptide repeat protein [Gemmatimonadota bacterium]
MPRSLSLALALALAIGGGDLRAQTDRAQMRAQLREAIALESAGQLGRAYIELQTILRDYPAEPGAVLAFERVCRRLSILSDALPAIRRAVEHDPGNALLRQAELRVLADLGRLAELIEAGERWLQRAPGLEAAYREYAQALSSLGEFERAEAVLLEGQRHVGASGGLAIALADLYMMSGARWTDAARAWLAIFESSPELAWDVLITRIRSPGLDARAFGEAVLDLIGGEPVAPGAARLAAIAAIQVGDESLAREMVQVALEPMSSGERRRFIQGIARLSATLQQPALVAWSYRLLLREAPEERVAWDMARQIVRHDLGSGDTAAAFATLDRFLDRTQPGSAAHRWAGARRLRLLAAGADADAAARAFQEHAALYTEDRDLPALALLVAEAFLREGRLDESRRILEHLPAAADGRLEGTTAVLRAYLALYAGEFDEARQNFETAAAVLTGPERGDAIRMLRILQDASPAELEAVSTAHRATLQGQLREAYRGMLDAFAGTPASAARPALLVWAGELAIEAGDLEPAREVMLRVPERFPDSGAAPVALITLAEAMAAADRRGEAIALLETLIIEYPGSALTPIGRRRLAELEGEVPRS